MERTVGPTLQDVSAGSVQLGVQLPESVVNRRGTEHTDSFPFPLLYLEPLGLYDYTQAFHEEDATENGQQQFLVNDDGTDTDDTANG